MNPIHNNYPSGGFFTRNPTNDPSYPPGSFYESMGWTRHPHNTNIYGPNGDLLNQTNPGATQKAARDIIIEKWDSR